MRTFEILAWMIIGAICCAAGELIYRTEHQQSVVSTTRILKVEPVKPEVEVKPGQIWGINDTNPFDPIRLHLVAVNNGWVKYYFVGQEKYGEWASRSESVEDLREFYQLVEK